MIEGTFLQLLSVALVSLWTFYQNYAPTFLSEDFAKRNHGEHA
jgi:hypothetical protein